MNLLKELKYNVDALEHVVQYHSNFFAPISAHVKRLKSIVSGVNATEQDEILFLAKKIEKFFSDYRPSDEVLYLPPSEAANNDDAAKEIYSISLQMYNLSSLDFNELFEVNNSLPNISSDKTELIKDSTKVFIVHGHDDLAKQEMARLVTELGFKPIILHEQASGGKTIIEKIEDYSNVGFAVVLYTPCDKGGKDVDPIDLQSRARQNVVFEHGYLIGKLGRENVCALVRGSVETPNDISGVVYVPIDPHGAWKYALADEMSNSGYPVDKNKIKA